ncbi:GNAT family N-acetyltransferase [Paenibacillus tarimensis]
MKPYIIRSERADDYHSISEVNAAAFDYSYRMGEATLVNVLRSRKAFDPDLSLVAELDRRVIGHVLFSPQQVVVGGKVLDAVLLAPIAVDPAFQKKGVGSQLINEGHRRAKEKGCHFSLLLGHPSYYPRFGYQPNMWSSSNVLLPLNDIPSLSKSVKERRIQAADLEGLSAMWDIWHQGIDMAFKPDASVTAWISPSKTIQAAAIDIDGHLSGYLRYDINHPEKILSILARDTESLVELCAYLKSRLKADSDSRFLSMPISPESYGRLKEPIPYRTEVSTGPEKMIKILNENSPIVEYCNGVMSGELSPGSIIWPVEFDVC